MLTIHIEYKAFERAGAPPQPLLEDVSFALREGEVCAVLGPSGIGKSTLLSMVAGLDRVFEGRIEGRAYPVGMLFQTPRLLPWRTVRENLAIVLAQRGGGADVWLKAIGLAGSAGLYPHELSLGMARRVALARALAIRPQLLILDEPFASLDDITAANMRDCIAEYLQASGPTSLIVSHHFRDVAMLVDRVITLEGVPAHIVRDERVQRTAAE
jgi:ABC-type nitrate/sulfonate/bicarbonate transport system ATPase subunit